MGTREISAKQTSTSAQRATPQAQTRASTESTAEHARANQDTRETAAKQTTAKLTRAQPTRCANARKSQRKC